MYVFFFFFTRPFPFSPDPGACELGLVSFSNALKTMHACRLCEAECTSKCRLKRSWKNGVRWLFFGRGGHCPSKIRPLYCIKYSRSYILNRSDQLRDLITLFFFFQNLQEGLLINGIKVDENPPPPGLAILHSSTQVQVFLLCIQSLQDPPLTFLHSSTQFQVFFSRSLLCILPHDQDHYTPMSASNLWLDRPLGHGLWALCPSPLDMASRQRYVRHSFIVLFSELNHTKVR